ncbi:MAG: hypothetical protein RLZZ69_3040, partial [Cyanobacteriota bacterium]
MLLGNYAQAKIAAGDAQGAESTAEKAYQLALKRHQVEQQIESLK